MVSVVVRASLMQLDTGRDAGPRGGGQRRRASNQLGEFESGVTAAWLGTVPSVVLGGIGTLLAVMLGLRLFPQLARIDRLESVRHV